MAKKTNQYDFSLSYVHFIEHLPCVKKKPPLKHGKKLGNLEKQQRKNYSLDISTCNSRPKIAKTCTALTLPVKRKTGR
jgi:hypothetical protein